MGEWAMERSTADSPSLFDWSRRLTVRECTAWTKKIAGQPAMEKCAHVGGASRLAPLGSGGDGVGE